jgi:RNA polymerase sigma-70 factor (ECF subfamily)
VSKASERCNPDDKLVRRAQAGDVNAFASIFEKHKGKIYSVCLRMTNNAAEAEDLTQDAFIQVFRKLATFRGDSTLATWLYRVAVNTVLMHFRKKEVRPASLDDPQTFGPNGARYEYGVRDECLAGCLDRITLARVITQLPDGYRTVYLLHEVQGYKHQEIAGLLECSMGNSKSQLHKAKLRIRELLGTPSENGKGNDIAHTLHDGVDSWITWRHKKVSSAIPIGLTRDDPAAQSTATAA